MATTLQFRRGSTANLASETGAVGELFVDTDKDTLVVMDGSTAGGFPLSRETTTQAAFDQANTATNDAASASQYANTGINNAASASAYANTGITLAQAAFDQANTGGGGGANTGNYTFSQNNITLTGNQNAVMNVSGNVFTFESDGTFISDTALLGDVLVTNDILTPLVYDSYGVVDPIQTGTLTVNGNLDVTGNLTATGLATANFGSTIVPDTNDRASAFTNGKILEINKKYFIQNSAGGHVIMPPTTGLSNGDVVEIYYKNSGGFTTTNLTVWAYAATGIGGDDIQKPAWINLNSLSPGESGGYAYMELSGQGMKITFIFRSSASKIWEIQY